MNLESFVVESLDEIMSGVAKAKKRHKGVAPSIAPKPGIDTEYAGVMRTKDGSTAYLVEFDVAVTVVEGANRKSNGGIAVAGVLSGAVAKDSITENRVVSRLSFRIPISLA